MIDLHCHILPEIDDGAKDIDMAIAMARIAVEDGIAEIACTPHIFPGVYENTTSSIRAATEKFQLALELLCIPLKLSFASDTHMMPDLVDRLKAKTVPTFNDGRYFLLEPPHHLAPPNFEAFVFKVATSGYVPIITHPERLTWVPEYYEVFERMAKSGVWLQITAGSLTGHFGKTAKYWAERMLADGIVHIIASDAHNIQRRAPRMAEAVHIASRWVGLEEALRTVSDRPRAILENRDPQEITEIPALNQGVNDNLSGYDKIRNKISLLIRP